MTNLPRMANTAVKLALGAGLAACCASSPAADDVVTIRLGTLAPRGSSFHRSLQMMGENWRKTSSEKARLTIFPDGVQGGEADMVRKMRAGRLNAGLLTAVGLGDIEPAVTCLQNLPMMFRSLEEVDYVGQKMKPQLEERLREKGFVVLFWGDAGWVRFFSTKPLATPDDLKRLKLFVWAGDTVLVDLWKSAGFRPFPLETADIVQGFRTGLIEAAAMPPVFAVAGQIYDPAPHMLELNWAPLVGACVVTANTWNRLPALMQEAFMKAAADAGREIKANNRKESAEAVEAMQKRGLKVQKVTPEIAAAWRHAVDPFYPKLRGKVVPADMFDEVKKVLEEHRAAGGN